MQNNHKWIKTSYNIPNSLLTTKLFKNYFRKFWSDFNKEHTSKTQVFLMIFVKYRSGQIKALGKASKVRASDSKLLLDNLLAFLRVKSDTYMNEPVNNIYFHYKFVSAELESAEPIIHQDRNPDYFDPATISIGGYNLPANMNILGGSWGKFKCSKGKIYIFGFKLNGVDMEYHINVTNYKSHQITLYTANNYTFKVLEFEDVMDKDPFNFTRTVNTNNFIIRDGVIVCKTQLTRSNYIKSVSKDRSSKLKMLTLDIETQNINNKVTPYCICYYDGKRSYSFYLGDYKTQD